MGSRFNASEIIEKEFEALVGVARIQHNDIQRIFIASLEEIQNRSLNCHRNRLIWRNRKILIFSRSALEISLVRFFRKIGAQIETKSVVFRICKHVFQKFSVELQRRITVIRAHLDVQAFRPLRREIQRHVRFHHVGEGKGEAFVAVLETELFADDLQGTDQIAAFRDHQQFAPSDFRQKRGGKRRVRRGNRRAGRNVGAVEIKFFNSFRDDFTGFRLMGIIRLLSHIRAAKVIDPEREFLVAALYVKDYVFQKLRILVPQEIQRFSFYDNGKRGRGRMGKVLIFSARIFVIGFMALRAAEIEVKSKSLLFLKYVFEEIPAELQRRISLRGRRRQL